MSEASGTAPQPAPLDPQTMPKRRGWPLGQTATIALAIAAVVVVATAIVLLAGNRPAVAYPPGSPEAAFQDYLRAWYDEDYATAYAFFSADAQRQMTYADFERQAAYGYGSGEQGVELDSVSGEGDARTLDLTVTEGYGGYDYPMTVRLRQEGGAWRIDQPLVGLSEYYPEERFPDR